MCTAHVNAIDLYYISFPKDRALPKTLVAVTLSLETVQLVLSTRDAFVNLASGWGNMEALDDVGWQWFSLPILMAVRELTSPFDSTNTHLLIKSVAYVNFSMRGGFGCLAARCAFQSWSQLFVFRKFYFDQLTLVRINSCQCCKGQRRHMSVRSPRLTTDTPFVSPNTK